MVSVTADGGVCWLATLAVVLGIDPTTVSALVPLCIAIVVLPIVIAGLAR